jgi:hypothetical protein
MCAAALSLVGWMPIMLRAEGWAFLPSVNWVTQSFWPGIACAAICAIVPSVGAIRSRARDGGNRKSIKYLFVLAFTPALFGTLGFYAVSAGGPMLYTWAVGKPTEVPYAIERTGRSEDWKCRNSILLQDLPPLTSKLCGFSEEFIASLLPGQTILVSGKGSPFGVFAASARLAD